MRRIEMRWGVVGKVGVVWAWLLMAQPTAAGTVNWVPDADGVWHTASNWSSNPQMPGASDDVVINVGGATVRTITHSQGTDSIKSLASEENVQLTGGSLALATTAQVNNTFTLNGGALVGGTVLAGTGGQGITVGNNTSNRLDAVTVTANMNLTASGSKVRIDNGLTLNGTASVNGSSDITFNPASAPGQTLNGAGEIVFTWANGWTPGLYIDGNTTLTLGPSVTIRGYGNVGQSHYTGGTDTLVNQGLIRAGSGESIWVRSDVFTNSGTVEAKDGGSLTIQSPTWSSSGILRALNTSQLTLQSTWSSSGTIVVNSATVNLQGTMTTAGLGTFSRSGGTVKLAGTLDNSGATLDLDSRGIGPLTLSAGTITGGTISASSGSSFVPGSDTSNRLVGVTMNANMDLTSSGSKVRIDNGLTLNGTASVSGSSDITFNPASAPGQTLNGSGEIVFTWANGWTPGLYIDGTTTLTLGPNVTIRGDGNVGQSHYTGGTDTLVNQGLIRAGSGNAFWVRSDVFTNSGTVEAKDGGSLTIQSPAWSSSGTLRVLNTSQLTLQNTWSSSGTIVVNNATVNLQGTMTTAGLGAFTRTGGTVKLAGTLNNSGATLDLDTRGIGSLSLSAGTITGGTVSAAAGSSLVPLNDTSNRLTGVTVSTGLNMTGGASRLRILNGLSLNGTASLDDGALLVFDPPAGGAQTLDGTGQIVLTNAAGYLPALYIDGTSTLTVGPDVTIRGLGYVGRHMYTAGTDTLINTGTITAAGTTLTLRPDILTNQGTMQATGGGSMTIDGATSFTNTGSLVVAASSTLALGTGTLIQSGGGSLSGPGRVTGNVSNAGTIQPGSTIGALTITGNCTQTSAGTIEIQINTTSNFDRLIVSGNLNLGGSGQGGTLKVVLTGSPLQDGNSVDILDFGSITGTFTTLDLTRPGPGLGWDTTSLYTTGVIRASAAAWAPTITGWVSQRTHAGGVGTLDISLDPSKTSSDTGDNGPIVEPRRHGLQHLIVTFEGPVQAADDHLDVGDVTVTDSDGHPYTPQTIALNDNTSLQIDFDPDALPDGMRYTFSLAGKFKSTANGNLVAGDTDCQVRCLVGDANTSGTLELADVATIKTMNRQKANASNCKYDMNLDGAVNIIDMALAMNQITAP